MFAENWLQKIITWLTQTIIGGIDNYISDTFQDYNRNFLSLDSVVFARSFINYFFPMQAIARAIIIYCGVMGFVFIYNCVLRAKGFIPTESEG